MMAGPSGGRCSSPSTRNRRSSPSSGPSATHTFRPQVILGGACASGGLTGSILADRCFHRVSGRCRASERRPAWSALGSRAGRTALQRAQLDRAQLLLRPGHRFKRRGQRGVRQGRGRGRRLAAQAGESLAERVTALEDIDASKAESSEDPGEGGRPERSRDRGALYEVGASGRRLVVAQGSALAQAGRHRPGPPRRSGRGARHRRDRSTLGRGLAVDREADPEAPCSRGKGPVERGGSALGRRGGGRRRGAWIVAEQVRQAALDRGGPCPRGWPLHPGLAGRTRHGAGLRALHACHCGRW